MDDKCPKCGWKSIGPIGQTEQAFSCNSILSAVDGFRPGMQCLMNQLAAVTAERDRLREACQSFRVAVHGIGQLDRWRANAVLGLFDDMVGYVLAQYESPAALAQPESEGEA